MRIDITADDGTAFTIIATPEFAEENYPGKWVVSPVQDDPPTAAVPESVTPAQALVALYVLKGITEQHLDEVVAAIEDEGDRYTAQIALKRATEWRRHSPTTQTVADLLTLSEPALDELFAFAAAVEV